MGNMRLIIKNVTVYLEETELKSGSIVVEGSTIQSIIEGDAVVTDNDEVIDGKGLLAIPGFIDGHIHGAGGSDVMDGTVEALDTMAAVLPIEGTTSFMATTITQSPQSIERALANAAHYQNKPGYAEMLGVHLEGPFINHKKAGAQPVEYITSPDLSTFDKWQEISGNRIKTITMAPEKDPDGLFISELANRGINVSAGHTEAGFNQIKIAAEQGLRQLTHLCNAMTGIHHRDIGAVGASFELDSLRSELIADGIHVSPEMVKLIFSNIGSERLILITDAMRAKGLPSGNYDLGGQEVRVEGMKAVLKDGTLAGSVLKMSEAVKNMMKFSSSSIRDIVKMASFNPAKQLNVYDRKGSLEEGKDADILLVNESADIFYTICKGKVAYRKEENA